MERKLTDINERRPDMLIRFAKLNETIVVVRPAAFLGNLFNLYRAVCSGNGGKWTPEHNGNVVHADQAPKMERALTLAGFTVEHSEVKPKRGPTSPEEEWA